MKKKVLAVLMAAVFVVTMSACGSDSGNGEAQAEAESAGESGEEAESTGDDSEAQAGAAASDGSQDAGIDSVVDEPATFDNIGDFIKLGDYKALNIERSEDVVTDGYPAEIGELVGYRLTFPEVDYGMTVTLDYVGTIDGVPFDGGTADGADLKIGSHSFIDDFEDQLVGAKVDDVVEVNVTFPEDYKADKLAGKDALFTCTIHAIWKDMWDGFVDMCTARQYPKDLYDMMLQTVKETNQSTADAYGMTVEDYKEAARLPEDEEQALIETKWALVNRGLLEDLGITEESETYKAMQTTLLTASGYEDVDAAIEAGLSEDQLRVTTEYYTAVQALLRERGVI